MNYKQLSPMKRHICATLTFALAVSAFAAPPANEREALSVEIARLLNNLHWRRMIAVSLQRGEPQALAKREASVNEEQRACVDREYTEDAVLALIATSYERVYSTSQVVAEVNGFVESSGGQKILGIVEQQARQVGTQTASQNLKPEQILNVQEQKYFELFAASVAGKEYLSARRQLPTVQRELLAKFAVSVQSKCSVRRE